MNLEEVKDKDIALIVWNTQKKDDVHVYLGKLQLKVDEYLFINEEKDWKVPLDNEQLNRLQPVSEDLKEMLLNADYFLSMTIASLPETGAEGYKKTGMKWQS